MRKFILGVLLLALFALPAVAQDEAGVAHLRVAHFAADAPNVDVFSKGVVVLRDVPFGTVSDWLELEAGAYNIAVSPTGRGINAAVIGPTEITLAAGDWITVAAVGSVENETITAQVITEDHSNIGIGNARITILHAAEAIPAVDVLVDGEPLIEVLGFAGSIGDNDGMFTTEVPAGVYNISVRITSGLKAAETDPEDVLADLPETELAANGNYLIAAIGTVDAPQVVTTVSQQADSIVDVLNSDGRFTTLLAAVEAAGLTETLDTGGPFTVFAPSDGAFATALETLGLTAEELLADTDTLTTILTYHVVDGAVTAEDAVAAGTATTLQGEAISIEQGAVSVVLNGTANVTRTNIEASNGIVHIVNEVLLPPSVAEALGLVAPVPEATVEATEEAPEATEEATVEATEEPEVEATEEATVEATEEAPAEATAEATEES